MEDTIEDLDPAHWEGDQYLLEVEVDPASDPKEPHYRYTERAEKAQKAKWQRLINNRKPRKHIPRRLLASSPGGAGGNDIPYLLYGWPFKKDHMVDYARRHHLVYKPTNNRLAFGEFDEFHFDQLTDEDLKDESKMPAYRFVAAGLVISQLIRATGLNIELGRPFTFEYDQMLFLWSNRDWAQHIADADQLGNFEKRKAIIEAVINDGNTGKKIELRWWWSWSGNGMGLFETLA